MNACRGDGVHRHVTSMTRFRWTFAIASMSFFVFALDRLVVTTALPAIRADLAADFADLEWTVNAYTLTFAVLVLTGAALGDRFGRRRVFVLGVGLFTAASVAAALVTDGRRADRGTRWPREPVPRCSHR